MARKQTSGATGHLQAAARQEVEEIKSLGQQGTQMVADALHRLAEFSAAGGWGRLGCGYASAVEFLDAEFPGLAQYAIPAEPRRELVAALAGKEPQQAIAARLGVDQATVSRDMRIMHLHNSESADADAKRGRGRPARTVIQAKAEPVSAAHATIDGSAAEDSKPEPVAAAPAAVSASVTDSLPTTRPAGAQEATTARQEARPAGKTVRLNPVSGPVPVACPGCRSRDELVADLQAVCVRLKAAHPDVVMAEELKVVIAQRDALRAEVARLSGGPDGAEQEDPGVHPQLEPEAADGGACARCTAPGAPLAWVLTPDGTKGCGYSCDDCMDYLAGEHPECGYSRAEPPDPPVTSQAELDDIYASFDFGDEVTA